MKSQKFIFAIVIGLALTGVTLPIALAQENTTTTTATTTKTPTETSVLQIDETTVLKDYEFTDKGVILYIEAERVRRMKLSDGFALAISSGAKEIPTKTLTLNEGENKVKMDLSTYNGMKGIVIATTGGTVGITEKTGGTSMFSGETSRQNIVIAGIGGGLFGVTLVGVTAWKRQYGISGNVEREL